MRTLRKMVPAFSLPGHFTFNDVIAAGRSMAFARPDLGPDDVAVLQYTGGTTGVAKGATLLHHTIVANLLASEAWMQPGLRRKQLTGQFTIVCALPLYHVFAFITCGLLGMRTGALNILIPNPRDMKGTVKELAKYRINIFPGVNTLFNALPTSPTSPGSTSPGSPSPTAAAWRCRRRWPGNGSPSPAARSSKAMASAKPRPA